MKSPFWYKYYTWRNPIRKIKNIYKNIKDFIQRGKYGCAIRDAWNTDSYLSYVIPRLLRTIASKGMSCPENKYASIEDWHNELVNLAKNFEYYTLNNDEINKYADEFYNHSCEDEELSKKFLNRDAEIEKEKEICIHTALTKLSEIWRDLWD